MRTVTTATPMMLLATIPKSGTNLFRIALVNYMAHLAGDLEPKTYDDVFRAFPNRINDYAAGAQVAADTSLLPNGYADFVYGHSPLKIAALDGPIVGLFRNPLDQLVSAYFYFYKNRRRADKQHPRDTFEEFNSGFIRPYKDLLSLRDQGRALLISYEDLTERTSEAVCRAAEFYAMPVKPALAELAADHSSLSRARQFEDENGHMHTRNREAARSRKETAARFIRDGRIGQWREWFSDAEVRTIKDKLVAAGVSPDDFTYLPESQPQLAP